MIVEEIFGDIFKTDYQTIACPVNTVGVMGRGLALYCAQRFPHVKTYYLECCRNKIFKTKLAVVPIANNKQILLIPTKNHWSEDSNEWLISRSLTILAQEFEGLNITSLAVPKIGCGNGHMEFDKVKELLYKYLDPITLPVKLYI